MGCKKLHTEYFTELTIKHRAENLTLKKSGLEARNKTGYKFNGKELDEETGNYYYGARYYDPKFAMWLSVDPLAEMYPGYSPYAYALNNPVNYIDPNGMQVKNGCGIGCKLRKLWNSIFHPDDEVNPNTGRLSKNYSRATGWKLGHKKVKGSDNFSSPQRPKQKAIATISPQAASFDIQINPTAANIAPPCNCPSNKIVIDGHTHNVEGPTAVSFDFANIGGIAHNDKGSLTDQGNYIYPLTGNNEQNLNAVADFLKSHPQATVRFQYKKAPAANALQAQDLREVYGKSFEQITNYLIRQGVNKPNERIIRNFGANSQVIIDDKK